MMVSEGSAKIECVEGVFYNPRMEINRDLLSAAVGAAGAASFCDGHAATGIKAIRVARENSCVVHADAVDLSRKAVALIEKNIALNGVAGKVSAIQNDIRFVLMRQNYDFVEIDPFGSPAPYLDALADSFSWRKNGHFSATATDTAVLCGAEHKACRRIYGAIPFHKEFVHESGIRILVARIQSVLAGRNLAAIPLLSLSHRHYIKLFFEVRKSAVQCDKLLGSAQMLGYCEKCKHREYFKIGESAVCGVCSGKMLIAGPFWSGLLHDNAFMGRMAREIEKRGYTNADEELRLLSTLTNENFDGFCYELHTLFRGRHIPKTGDVLKALRDNGFNAAKTAYKSWTIRTNATAKDIYGIVKV
ncbi:MAG: hypothetical protein N3G76_02375 [Candidatus Micrarchaeota archaeon]|nr:hypothetical protein [Candidatus Micrarchaeota archaeon]